MLQSPPHKKRRARLLWAFSFALTLGSLPCVISLAYEILTGAPNIEGNLIVGTFMVLVLVVAIALGFKARKASREANRLVIPEDLERYVLHLAKKGGGEISATMLAMETKLNMDQAAHMLAEFEQRGHAYSVVVGEGSRRYVFPDLKTTGLIASAKTADAEDFMRRLAEADLIDEKAYHEHES